ncbi:MULTISPECIES: glycosyltransferase [unclassified Lentimonas]|uniref:glycosyltransferase n=1 Tax=unclassified Lentimonas TaxID=2630993 RepID=UPI001322AED6|nr:MULTISPECIES: glycosyltransferase [unclassified Lentimonas]CAA6693596.1 Glycosyltransferase [Lentimonas sp. CC10]CAA6696862.1 Glycosyltransferase [Lentimonas sp. CC19]CAA7071175.1 Glycosyltransferase [Lentimonas sp. CC11]
MKILHYTGAYAPAWKVGGPVRSVSQICEGLAARGHEVTVLTTNIELEEDRSIIPGKIMDRNGVSVTYFKAERDWTGVRSRELEAAIRERITEFDIVHVTGVWQPTSVAACRAAERVGVPYIVSPRGALGAYSWTQKVWKKYPYWWLFERRNCSAAAAVHYTTTMEAEECRRFKLPGEVALIPNSVGLDFWRYDQQAADAWRAAHGMSSKTKLLLNAGRLHHKKGLDLLPEVLAGIAHQDWKMVFVGSDDDGTKASLIREFERLNLRNRILFLDTIEPEALRGLYSAADVFLLPSRHENFGNVVIEALACSCPIILSEQVGVAEDLVDYEGVTILPNKVPDWVSAIETTVASQSRPDLLAKLDQCFSGHAVVEKVEALYRSLIKS